MMKRFDYRPSFRVLVAALFGLLLIPAAVIPAVSAMEWKEQTTGGVTPLAQTIRNPIRINGNSDFTTGNGVKGGAGTPGNPWIISDYYIDGTGYGYCIYIGNTTDSFIIRNCTLLDADGSQATPYEWATGLCLYAVKNGEVYNTSVTTCGRHGIWLYTDTSNVTIHDVSSNSNTLHGICLESNADDNYIYNGSFNTSTGGGHGVCIYDGSDDNIVKNFYTDDHGGGNNYGVYIQNSQRNIVDGFSSHYNHYGVYIENADYNEVNNVTTHHNQYYGIYVVSNSNYNVFRNYETYHNVDYTGVRVISSADNEFHNGSSWENDDWQDGGGFWIDSSQRTTIDGFDSYRDGRYGVNVEFSPDCNIYNVSVEDIWADDFNWPPKVGGIIIDNSDNTYVENMYGEDIQNMMMPDHGGVTIIDSDYSYLVNVSLRYCPYGIYFSNSHHTTIIRPNSIDQSRMVYGRDSNFPYIEDAKANTQSGYYIYLYNCDDAKILNSTVKFRGYLTYLRDCQRMLVQNVTVDADQSNYRGMYFRDCQDLTMTDCNASYCPDDGVRMENVDTALIKNCTFNGNSKIGIYGDGGCSNVDVINCTGNKNGDYGFYVYGVNTLFENLTANENQNTAILMRSATNGLMVNCTALDNGDHGLWLYQSPNALIKNCTSINNNYYGMYVYSSDGIEIVNTTMNDSRLEGLYLDMDVDNARIHNNTISGNGRMGIVAYHATTAASSCSIYNNTIEDNAGFGIYMNSTSSNNKIYHNKLYDNNDGGPQGFDNSNSNQWDNGFEGNYWGDYKLRYPTATSNGIYWSIPYLQIGITKAVDRYPLADESLNDPNFHFPIRINSNSDFTAENGVSNPSAAGTAADPFIIKDLNIDGRHNASCIYVGNTTDHFVIQNCNLRNAKGNRATYYWDSGIGLYNVENGIIKNNVIEMNSGDGITMQLCTKVELDGNLITHNGGRGLLSNDCDNLTIKNNVISENECRLTNSKGVVGYWDMDQDDWTQIGSYVEDKSGNENHGLLMSNGMTNGYGVLGNGGNFDMVNDYIETSAKPNKRIFTLEAWFKADRTDGTEHYSIVSQWGAGGNGFATSMIEIFDNEIVYAQHDGSITTTITTPFSDTSSWHHVVGVHELGNSYLYLDGQLVAGPTATSIPQISTQYNFMIGRSPHPTASDHFDGQIDEVRIYDRPLSGSEVKKNYVGASSAISLTKSENCVLDNNTVIDNLKSGIHLYDSVDNQIKDGVVQGNSGEGILIDSSDDNIISNNEILGNSGGEKPNDDGLVLWLPLDEVPYTGVGDEAKDISGRSNNGSALNGVTTLPEGVFGRAASFLDDPSANDAIEVKPANGFPRSELTASFWMKSTDTTRSGTTISYAGGGHDNEFLLFDHRAFTITVDQNAGSGATGVSANDGEWHHIAVTWRNTDGQTKLFKDGIVAWSGTVGVGRIIDDGGTLCFGQDQDSASGGAYQSSQAFVGLMDDARIYNRALSEDEVKGLYSAVPGGVAIYDSDNIEITDNLVQGNFGPGVLVDDSDSADISGNEINGNTNNGIILDGATETTIDDNIVTMNHNTQSLDKGLVGYWNFDNGPCDGTPGEIPDLSGNGFHGQAMNGLGQMQKDYGMAGDFDGSNDYVTVENVDAAIYTVSAFAKFERTGNYERLVDFGEPSGSGDWQTLFCRYSTTSQMCFQAANNNVYSDAGFIINGEWHHYAVSQEGLTVRFYRDGVQYGAEKASVEIPKSHSRSTCYLGRSNWPDDYFQGRMDEVRVYDRPLNASEMYRIFQVGKGSGILLNNAVNTTITNNEISDNNGWGLKNIGSIGLDIDRNEFLRNQLNGIHIEHMADLSITNNDLIGNKKTGLHLEGCEAPTITGNDLHQNTAGIALVECNGSTVSNNNASFNRGDRLLDKGLVGHWKFNEYSWSGEAGCVEDSSGHNNDGISINSDTSSDGILQHSGYFSGSTSYIDIPTNNGLVFDYRDDFTYALWAKTEDTGRSTLIGDYVSGAGALNMELHDTYSGNLRVFLYDENSNLKDYWTTFSVADGTWHHLAFTYRYSPQELLLFVDGQQVPWEQIVKSGDGTLDSMISNTDQTNRIGNDNRAGGLFYDGLMDDVRIYERALSPFEMESLYETRVDTPAGIFLDTTTNTTIDDCDFYSNIGSGVTVYNTSGVVIEDNTFTENKGKAVDLHWVEGITVQENEIYGSSDVFDPSLVAYYKFDESSYTEFSDDVWDSSGYGFNAYTSKNYTNLGGAYGNSINFTADGWVEVPPEVFDSVSGEISISFWHYGNATAQPVSDSIFEGYDTYDRCLNLHHPWGNGRIYWDAGSQSSADRIEKQATPDMYEGNWEHWVVTKNTRTGVMQIFFNGERWHYGTGKYSDLTEVIGFKIGAYFAGTTRYNGLVDEFRIYDRELDDLEIKSLFLNSTYYSNTTTPDTGVLIEAAQFIDINNNTAMGLQGPGLHIEQSNKCQINDNSVSNGHSTGLELVKSDSSELLRNTIEEHECLSTQARLVGHWDFEELSYSGAVGEVVDETVFGHHGAAVGDTKTVNGLASRAVYMDGTGDRIDVPWTEELSVDGDISMMAWVNTSHNQYQTIIAGSSGSNVKYGIMIGDTGQIFYYCSTNLCWSTLDVNDGKWHHVAVVHHDDLDLVSFYVDGVEQQQVAVGTYTAAEPTTLHIGYNGHDSNAYFEGQLDDVRVYDGALTTDEVLSVYSQSDPSACYLYDSHLNTFIGNTFKENDGYGMALLNNADDNILHHNDFIWNRLGYNTTQACDFGDDNLWHDGVEGNFWTDWQEPDADMNGIVDVAYNINGTGNGGADLFPLTPYIVPPTNLTAYEDVLYDQTFDLITTHGPTTWSFDTNATWLTTQASGTVTGTPVNGEHGWYWLNATAMDLYSTKNISLILTVFNTNDGPTILTSDVTNATEEAYYYVLYEAIDEDPTFDTFTWALETNASFLVIDPVTGALYGTPMNNDVGSWFVNVSAVDNLGGVTSSNFTLVVTDINDNPEILTTDDPVCNEDELYEVDYEAIDIDLVGDTLTWALITDAPFLTIDPVTGVLNGTPLNEHVGTYSVEVQVSDGRGGMDFNLFELIVRNVNDDPVILTDNVESVLEDRYYIVDYNATDIDPTNDELHWEYVTNADFLDFDKELGILSGTPDNSDVGTYFVKIEIRDDKGGYSFTNFTLEVINVNDDPVITTTNLEFIDEDSDYVVNYAAIDDDPTNDILNWSIRTNCDFLKMNNKTGVLTGTPTNADVGIWWVHVYVSDGRGGLGDTNFTLTVNNLNDLPSWLDVPEKNIVLEVTQNYEFDVNATDPDAGDVLKYSVSTSPSTLMVIDANTGLLSWVAESIGIMTVSLTASDGTETITYIFQIEVIARNARPKAVLESPIKDETIDVLNPMLKWSGSDEENEPLTYDVYLSSSEEDIRSRDVNARVKTGTVLTSYTSSELEKGTTYFWTVIPHDGNNYGTCSSGIWTFTVSSGATLNTGPRFTSNPETNLKVGKLWTYVLVTVDDQDDPVTYSILEMPPGMNWEAASATLTWEPTTNGTFSVIIQASDGNTITLQEFDLEVKNDDDGGRGDAQGVQGWLVILIVVVILVVILLVMFIAIWSRRKRSELSKVLEEIDEIYEKNQKNPKKCEKLLEAKRDIFKVSMEDGNLSTETFMMASDHIDNYLDKLERDDQPKMSKGKSKKKGDEDVLDAEVVEAEVVGSDIFMHKEIHKATGIEVAPPPGEEEELSPSGKKMKKVKLSAWDLEGPTIEEDGTEAEPELDIESPPETPEIENALEGESLLGDSVDPYSLSMEDIQTVKPTILALPPAVIIDETGEDVPKIDEIFVMTNDGILLQHFSNKNTTLVDEDILTGMLTVIQNFISDTFDTSTSLNTLALGDFNVIISAGDYLKVVAITQEEDMKPLKRSIDVMLENIEDERQDALKDFTGDIDSIGELRSYIKKLMKGGYLEEED